MRASKSICRPKHVQFKLCGNAFLSFVATCFYLNTSKYFANFENYRASGGGVEGVWKFFSFLLETRRLTETSTERLSGSTNITE